MTMQCVRCHAEDTRPARFCRACGYPYAFDEFMACPVCGGEVRSGTKICPGCHHQFAIPVLAKAGEVRTRRRSYLLPAAGGLALAGLAFFYVSAGKELFLEPESVVAAAPTVQEATEIPSSENAASLFTAPSSVSEVPPLLLKNESSAPEQDVPAPAAVEPTPTRSAPPLLEKEGSAHSPPLSRMDDVLGEKREEPKVAAKALKPEIKTEPKAMIELVPLKPVVETAPENLTPVPSLETVVEVKAKQEARSEKASVAAAERPKVSSSKRGAPVVERSRVAEPGQVNAIARQTIRSRDCAGKWEGDCRQFPDHKPNW